MHVVNALVPVFLIVALGAGLRKGGFLRPGHHRNLNRLAYWVGLPCLLFHKTANASFQTGPALRIFGVLFVGAAACILGAFLLSWLMGVERRTIGTFVQASYRGNLAFVGLPVILGLAAGGAGSDAAHMETVAVQALAPVVPMYNVVAVLVLLIGRKETGSGGARRLLVQFGTNPLLLACVLGILCARLDLGMPWALDRGLEALGRMALPLALIGLGASLVESGVRGRVVLSVSASVLKLLCAPLAGYLAGLWIGLSPVEMTVALVFLATPTAVSSYVLAEQMGGDEALAASSVVICTLLSVVALAVVLSLTP